MAKKSEDDSDDEDKSSSSDGEKIKQKDSSKHKRSKHSKKKSKKKSKRYEKSRKRHRDRSSSRDKSSERSNSEAGKTSADKPPFRNALSTQSDLKNKTIQEQTDSTSKILTNEQIDTVKQTKQPGDASIAEELQPKETSESQNNLNSSPSCKDKHPDVSAKEKSGDENKNEPKSEKSNKGSKSERSNLERSRSKERSKSKERSRKKPRSKKRSKSKERSMSKERSRSRSANRSRKRSREQTQEISKSKKLSGVKSKSISKERSRSPERSKERAISKSQKIKRSKEKSISRGRSNGRSRSKERSKSKEKSRSKERSKSRGRSKEKSRSRREERSKDKPRSKERSRSRMSKERSRQGSKSRDGVNQRSSRGSRERWTESDRLHKRSFGLYSRQRSRERRYSPPRYRDNRNYRRYRSGSADRRRSSSRTRHRSDYEKRSKRSRSRSGEAVAASIPVNLTIALGKPTTTVTTTTAKPPASVVETKSIADFTALCMKLTESDDEIEGHGGPAKVAAEEVFHPFIVKPAREIVKPAVIFPVAPPMPVNDPNKPLEQSFPVSSGNQHKTKEDSKESSIVEGVDGSVAAAEQVFQTTSQQEKLDVSGLIVKRLAAQNRLLSNPNDFEAQLVLQEVQMKIQNWASVNLKPGQFTGLSLAHNLMPKESINSGYQAWVKKDMFHNLAPIKGGIGMRLLEKMGWKPGQVIGKRGEGNIEPIALSVKMDRKGLISCEETGKGKKGGNRNVAVCGMQGKHPVSALAELCTKRRWQPPVYNVVHESGPDHKKDFLYQVVVNGCLYQFNIASNNKKLSKAQAAFSALQGLGVVPANATM